MPPGENTAALLHNDVDIKFTDLALLPQIQKAIAAIGYETPTPIQAQAIPHLLQGRDILGVAQTGTGKTGAFALPLLCNLDLSTKAPQILVLTPTRELAIQVAEAFHSYAKFLSGFHVLPVYGGVDYRSQIRQLERGVHVIVGTPGRIMDHMRRKTLVLDHLTTLVLDEADEMLRMGFIDDVQWILDQVPDKHQTALFSATMPAPIKKIANKYLQNPAEVTISVKAALAPAIRQRFLQLNNSAKLDTLTRILDVEEFDAVLIFVRTKNATLEVAERLKARGYGVEALNGDIVQNQREKTLARLKSNKIDLIVATDVAARGLDVDRISHVVNYDVPYDTESYIHRIGRTGRAGRRGDAVLFVNSREKRMLYAIERATGQKIEVFEFPSLETLNERKIERLFRRIDAELQKDLAEYRSVITKYLKRTDTDPVMLAAAMASLEAGGKPFYFKPSQDTKQRSDARSDTRSDARSDQRRGRTDSRGPATRGPAIRGPAIRQPDSPFKPDKKVTKKKDFDTELYRLEVGAAHGVSKADIVGAIANEAGLESRYMGKIRILEDHSFIDLPEGMPKKIFKDLKKVWLRGQKLKISKVMDASADNAKPEGGAGQSAVPISRPVKRRKKD